MNSKRILSVGARCALIITIASLAMMAARITSGARASYQPLNPCAVPIFALPAPLLPTPGLSSFTAGDFNNDGRDDLVTLAYVEQYALSFAAGNSLGVFDLPRSGSLGFTPRARMALKAADFNNDGKLDLLFIDGAAGSVYLRLGDGAGGFAAPLASNIPDEFIGSDSPAQTVIADFNNDRHLDIVVTDVFVAKVYVLLGAGGGRFNPPLSFVPTLTTISARALGAGDFNGDGKVDLIYLINRSFQFLLLPGNGNGSFGAGVAVSYLAPGTDNNVTPSDMVIGETNGDGKPDVIIASTKGVSIVPGDGAGGFGAVAVYVREFTLNEVIFADFDGDGRGDLVVGSFFLLRGLANGQFSEPAYPLTSREGDFKTLAADFNGDGLADLLLTRLVDAGTYSLTGFTVLPGDRAAGLAVPQGQLLSRLLLPRQSALADFNGDGALDLVAPYYINSNDAGFAVAFGNNTGGFGSLTSYQSGQVQSSAIHDLNADGKPDLVLTNQPAFGAFDMKSWLNNGSGGFTLAQTIPMSVAQYKLDLADFNSDGQPDLALNRANNDGLSLWAGNGNGTFTVLRERLPVGFQRDYVTGDFNGDGKVDLATWARVNSNEQAFILSGDGRGNFTETGRVTFAQSIATLAAADFNGDGRTDLLTSFISSNNDPNNRDKNLVVALANNAGGFAAPVTYSGPASTDFLTTDFNGDGKLDFITFSRGVIYTNRGDGSFDGPLMLNASGALAAGDVNRDGTIDLLALTSFDNKGLLFVIPNLSRCSAPGTLTTVSAASYRADSLAAESIAALFGNSLTNETRAATGLPLPTLLGGVSLKIKDSIGVEHAAPLFFAAPGQINYQVPPGIARGTALLSVVRRDAETLTATLPTNAVSPGLFSADATGAGYAAAVALRIKADGAQSFEPVAVFDQNQNRFVARPLDLGPEGEQVFLLIFGTGVRGRSSLAAVTASVGEVDAPVLYAGPQSDFVGLDQVNLALPRSLAGRGDVEVVVSVNGQPANPLSLNIK